MIVCAESTFDDLAVIVHEMGHLQYYMAFANQPPIFQVTNFFDSTKFVLFAKKFIGE